MKTSQCIGINTDGKRCPRRARKDHFCADCPMGPLWYLSDESLERLAHAEWTTLDEAAQVLGTVVRGR